MSTIDVRNKQDLKTSYPVYTKTGNVWKNRINWSDIEQANTSIVTHYGTFTFTKAERINKVWYWIVKDDNKTFRIKRTQIFNKRIPKSITLIEEPSTFTFKYQLCLPLAREYIDLLVEEADAILKVKRDAILKDKKNYTKEGKLSAKAKKLLNSFNLWQEPKPLNHLINELPKDIQSLLLRDEEPAEERIFKSKVNHIIAVAVNHNKVKYFKNALIKGYHPDVYHEADAEIKMQIINKIISII